MRNLVIIALITLLAACEQSSQRSESSEATTAKPVAATSEQSESDRLNEWFEARYEEELMFSPIGLTMLGRKERYGEIDDFTDAALDEQLEWKRKTVADMEAGFDYDALDDATKVSYDLWKHQYTQATKAAEMRRQGYVFHQMGGIHSFMPTFLMSFHKVETAADMQAQIARTKAVGVGMNQLIELAKAGIEAGVRSPRFAYEIVTQQAKDVISGAPFDDSGEDSALWGSAKGKIQSLLDAGTIDQAQADELLAQQSAAFTEALQPAYQQLVDFLTADLPNTAEVASGVHALPNGEAYYKMRLEAMTTTDMTADEIHQLGLDEVARLRVEMEQIKDKSGFEGSLQEFFTFIRDSKDDPRFYYPDTDEGRQAYIDDATAAINNIKTQLPNYFGILPKADLEVKRVEPFREEAGAPQHYFAGTPDGSRPGIYYAHLSDMKAMPKNQLEVIAYHEGLPGHHMQISIQQELTGIPTFRTQARFTAYSEGWGLYSEILAKEMPDTYVDLYSDFGRLTSEIWRAIRLVVDTGMHAKGWSQQQAVDYFAANSPAAQTAIEAEVRRYLVIPGQATSYKIGMIAIQKMRAKAEQKLGDKFDIRSFHDVILGAGALPLDMLEARVDRWISEQI
ncbi:MAG: DUF885 domain-containing protein [Gammaproteobacteria bacterium]|nr:DUF885 domain-containing protein [Gammaproteobacteria bacterium]